GCGGVSTEPKTPLLRPDGTVIFNGIPEVQGRLTVDMDAIPAPYSCDRLPLSYELSTQGATYSRKEEGGCMNALTWEEDEFSWHVEGPSLSHEGGLDSSIQDFFFKFEQGVLASGHFKLDYMFDSELGVSGSVTGIITTFRS